MKILVIQLARLGDLLQTLPTIAALKRMYPQAEVQVLARKTFSAPLEQSAADRVWLLDSRAILKPMIDEKPDFPASLAQLSELTQALKNEAFDRIINLSFSPLSSYLTREIGGEPVANESEGKKVEVCGYTRFDDGFLSIPDDGSAYFYAQVGYGPGRTFLSENANRLHVTDLFAHIAGVELVAADWQIAPAKNVEQSKALRAIGEQPIVVHIGASNLAKTLSSHKWLRVIKGLLEKYPGEVVLIGSKEERGLADQAAFHSGPRQAVNLVGETSIEELVEIVRCAKLLIGGDSAPVQVASLTGTPVLNLSFPTVSFWETGPRSKGTRILCVTSEEAIASDEIVKEAIALIAGEPARLSTVSCDGPVGGYVQSQSPTGVFEWELLKSVYMNEAFPPAPHELFLHAVKRLSEANALALEQIAELRRNPKNTVATSIIDRVDEIMAQITQMVPEIGVLVRWFKTERIRLGPMPVANLIDATEAVHVRLSDILSLYLNMSGEALEEERRQKDKGHDDILVG